MSRSSAAHAVREDLTDWVEDIRDVVAPRVGSAVQTVATKTPPAIERGRAAAAATGSAISARSSALGGALGETLVERLPDDVLDRLPETLAQHLPRRRRRGRTALIATVLVAGVAAVVVSRRRSAPAAGQHLTGAPYAPYNGAAGTSSTPASQDDDTRA